MTSESLMVAEINEFVQLECLDYHLELFSGVGSQ